VNRKGVLSALLVMLFLSALEATIVTTAMKSIVADLGGIEWMSMVFAVYLLVAAVAAPIYGKLADLYGRKRLFMTAVALFLLGSVLCGLAGSMSWLVVFRAVPAFPAVLFAAGFGLGMCRVLTVLMQQAVEGGMRGIAMSTNALMNTLGQTVFAAVFGAVFNAYASGEGSRAPAQGFHAVFIGVSAVMALTLLLAFRLPAASGGGQAAGARQD